MAGPAYADTASMDRHLARLLAAACAAVMLTACGQKGPLYLPGDPSRIQTEIPPEPAEPGDNGGDETDDEPDSEPDSDPDSDPEGR